MPQNVPVAAFVFGAILVLLALLGGGFKLFGAEIPGAVGKQARIFAGVAGAIFIFLGLFNPFERTPPPPPRPDTSTSSLPSVSPVSTEPLHASTMTSASMTTVPPTATPVVCFIAGTVVNEDNNQPLSNVQIAYLRITRDANEYIHGVRSKLATTDTKGKFEADCSSVEKENFPLRLELSRPGWCSILQTNEYVRLGEKRTAINLFASDKSMKTIGCR